MKGGAKLGTVRSFSDAFSADPDPSLALENISRLNASTPLSTPSAGTIVADVDVAELARKGLSIVVVGARLGKAGSNEPVPNRSGTRATINHIPRSVIP
jgi:hypothetical protein